MVAHITDGWLIADTEMGWLLLAAGVGIDPAETLYRLDMSGCRLLIDRINHARGSGGTGLVPQNAPVGSDAEDFILTTEDVHLRLGISTRAVRKAADRGTLQGLKVDGIGEWRFTEDAADTYASRRLKRAGNDEPSDRLAG